MISLEDVKGWISGKDATYAGKVGRYVNPEPNTLLVEMLPCEGVHFTEPYVLGFIDTGNITCVLEEPMAPDFDILLNGK